MKLLVFRGEREDRLERQCDVNLGAKVFVDFEAAVRDDLAGIENVLRIKNIFDVSEQLHQLITHEHRHVFGAQAPCRRRVRSRTSL